MGAEAIIARGLQLLIALAGAYVVALWFVLVIWTFRDIESRSRSVVTQVFSTLMVVLFFVPGLLLYWVLRPKETLDEAFQRSLEEEYLLQDLEELPLCPSCQHYMEDDFVICPHCHAQLREPCPSCERRVDLRWSLCPYCGAVQHGREVEEAAQVESPAARWVAPGILRRKRTADGAGSREALPAGEPEVASAGDDRTEPGVAAAKAGESQAEPLPFPAPAEAADAKTLVRRIDRFRPGNGARREAAENGHEDVVGLPLVRLGSGGDEPERHSGLSSDRTESENWRGAQNGHGSSNGNGYRHRREMTAFDSDGDSKEETAERETVSVGRRFQGD